MLGPGELAYDLPCMYNQACNAKKIVNISILINARVMAEYVCRKLSVDANVFGCVRCERGEL